jgi:hypothetical protein
MADNIFKHTIGIGGFYIFVSIFLRILNMEKYSDLKANYFDFNDCLNKNRQGLRELNNDDQIGIKKFNAIMIFFILSYGLDIILEKIVYKLAPPSLANFVKKVYSILPIGTILFFGFIIYLFVQSGDNNVKTIESLFAIWLTFIFIMLFFTLHAAIYAGDIFESSSPSSINNLESTEKNNVYNNPYIDNLLLWNGIVFMVLALRNLIVNFDTYDYNKKCTFAVFSFIGIQFIYMMLIYGFYLCLRLWDFYKNNRDIDSYLQLFRMNGSAPYIYLVGLGILFYDVTSMCSGSGKSDCFYNNNKWINKYVVSTTIIVLLSKLYDWRKRIYVELLD